MRVVSRLIMIAAAMMLIIFAVAACVHPARHPVDVLESGTYAVDPLFEQFVTSFGGKEVLGSPISLRFTYYQVECQYLQNALLCYDPLKPDRDRFNIYPLGKTFPFYDNVTPIVDPGDGSPVDRSLIYNEFIPFFEKFGGETYVGKPLTRVLVNNEQHRVEQYFENLGFYRLFNDPMGDVHLLSYGSYACAGSCPFASPNGSAIIQTDAAILDQPFTDLLAKTNNLDAFGQPLSRAELNKSKKMEQVYEAVVVISPADDPTAARLFPLPVFLGATTMPPGPQTANEKDNVKFIPVKGNLGYHVPLVFDQFICAHGGYALSGKPIAEIIQYQPHIYRQCFRNYCLDYDPRNPEDARVRMAQLGREYLLIKHPQPKVTETTELPAPTQPVQPEIHPSDRPLDMQVNESFPHLPVGSEQTINLIVVYADDRSPAVNIGATLLVYLPDGNDYRAQFPLTGPDGKAVIQVPAMPDLENSAVMTFKVCLDQPGVDAICVSDGYMIWNIE